MVDVVNHLAGLFGIGIAISLLGYLIKTQEWAWLIAGYNESTAAPKSVAADIIGTAYLWSGGLIAAVGLLNVVISVPEIVIIGLVVVVLAAVARAIYRLNTWSPANDSTNHSGTES